MDVRPCFLVFSLLVTTACRETDPAQGLEHPPAEFAARSSSVDDGEEDGESKRLRTAWVAEMHRTPSGADWQAIERRNVRDRLARWNAHALVGSGAPSFWTERGSENQSGRVHVTRATQDGTGVYVGTDRGGVFRGGLDGSGWNPVGDAIFGGAHELAVLPPDAPGGGDVILAVSGTGAALDATQGAALVTRDGGLTWTEAIGLPQSGAVRRVLRASDGSNTVWVLKEDAGTWKLFRSKDALASFQVIRDLGTYAGDVWAPRTGGSDLYLLDANRVFLSTDQGDSFAAQGVVSSSVATHARLAGSEAGAPRLYAVLLGGSGDAVHRSDDAGGSWSLQESIDDPLYWVWEACDASIVDPDVFAYGGFYCNRTVDGGQSFDRVTPWPAYVDDPANNLHGDVPGIECLPVGAAGETWYVSTDGGLFRSQDSLATVENLSLSGLRISQYYSTLSAPLDPDRVAAGSQDQGLQWSTQPPPAGSTTKSFDQLQIGDVGPLTSGSSNLDLVFAGALFSVRVLEDAGGVVSTASFPQPPGEPFTALLEPVLADPANPNDFFWFGRRVHKYVRQGASMTWAPQLHSSQSFATSGYISAVATSPLIAGRAWVGTLQGDVWRSDDGLLTWTKQVDGGTPEAKTQFTSALVASGLDADLLYAGGNGYASPPVVRSLDGGSSWSDWSQGLPPTFVYDLVEAPDGSGTLFAAGETAAFRRARDGARWVEIAGGDAPITTYWSVEALPLPNAVRFGTYGRGIWDYAVVSGSVAPIGCGGNPAGSLVVIGGAPHTGDTLTVGLDNPLGSQGPSTAVVGVSAVADPAYPCGTTVPGLGMGGPGAGGELLLGLGPELVTVVGTVPWTTPGQPAPVELDLPSSTALVGVTLFAQGVLVDPVAAGGVGIALTEGIEIFVGN